MRFYGEYMGMGVALKPLGDRWFTIRFRGIMNAWDSDPLQKPIEGNPILPWKNWDSSWRNKLKTEVLQALPGPSFGRCHLCNRRKWSPDCQAGSS
jgi:hypothetical protein